MRKLPKLRRRLTPHQRVKRMIRTHWRQVNEQDRDTQKWAEERRIPDKFLQARLAGKRKQAEEQTDADRLAAIGLLNPGEVEGI